MASLQRTLSPQLEPSLKAQLDDWEKQGVIEDANSPWSANPLGVKKKNGKMRWCIGNKLLRKFLIYKLRRNVRVSGGREY